MHGALAAPDGERAAPQGPLLFLSSQTADQDQRAVRRLRELLDRRGLRDTPLEHRQVFGAERDTTLTQTRDALTAHRPRLVFSNSMLIARSVQELDATTPIVFAGAADPVGLCLTDSLARPGRNATGYTSYLPAEPKLIEALTDAFPTLRRVVVLIEGTQAVSTGCRAGQPQWTAQNAQLCRPGLVSVGEAATIGTDLTSLAKLLKQRDVRVDFHRLCNVGDFAQLERYAARKDIGVVVPLEYLFFLHSKVLVDTVDRLRLPAIYARSTFVTQGGGMSLAPASPSGADGLQRAFELAAQVLKGADPANLPVQTPNGFDLWINTGVLAREGLAPSLRSLRRADHLLD